MIDDMSIQQVAQTMQKITQFQKVIQQTLRQNHDYGVVPGTDKPTLLKPGAEKILMMMGLQSEFEIVDSLEILKMGFFSIKSGANFTRVISSLRRALEVAIQRNGNT